MLVGTVGLTPSALSAIRNFRGYGRLDAPLLFLGLEEGLGQRCSSGTWSTWDELNARASWPSVVDARVACASIGELYWTHRRYSAVWRFAAKIALGILNRQPECLTDRDLAHRYVIDSLGRSSGQTLLGELMPLPAKGLSQKNWPYHPLYPTRREYEALVWPERLAMCNRSIAGVLTLSSAASGAAAAHRAVPAGVWRAA